MISSIALFRLKKFILSVHSWHSKKQFDKTIPLNNFWDIFFFRYIRWHLLQPKCEISSMGESERPAQSTGCRLIMLYVLLFLFSRAVQHTVLSPTNQRANFRPSPSMLALISLRAPQSPAGWQHCSLAIDNLDGMTLAMWATTGSGGNMAVLSANEMSWWHSPSSICCSLYWKMHEQYAL